MATPFFPCHNQVVNPGSEVLVNWLPAAAGQGEEELELLARLHAAGLAVAPIMLVPPESQENFYRYGNLVRLLSEVFEGVDPADADEDDLEERAPEAMALITGSYLLDEVIDDFYETVAGLPELRRVRRPGLAGMEARGQRASLLAVKRMWAQDWSFEALTERLADTATFRLEARPLLIHAADVPATDRRLLEAVTATLGRPSAVHVSADGAITRLAD